MKNEEEFYRHRQACQLRIMMKNGPHIGFNAEKNNETVDHIGRRKYERLVVRQFD